MKTISVGNKVRIIYTSGNGVVARVLHNPQGAGDVWEFQEIETQRIFVQNPYSPELDRWELIVEHE